VVCAGRGGAAGCPDGGPESLIVLRVSISYRVGGKVFSPAWVGGQLVSTSVSSVVLSVRLGR
jgi:hypothetical protein